VCHNVHSFGSLTLSSFSIAAERQSDMIRISCDAADKLPNHLSVAQAIRLMRTLDRKTTATLRLSVGMYQNTLRRLKRASRSRCKIIGNWKLSAAAARPSDCLSDRPFVCLSDCLRVWFCAFVPSIRPSQTMTSNSCRLPQHPGDECCFDECKQHSICARTDWL